MSQEVVGGIDSVCCWHNPAPSNSCHLGSEHYGESCTSSCLSVASKPIQQCGRITIPEGIQELMCKTSTQLALIPKASSSTLGTHCRPMPLLLKIHLDGLKPAQG